MIITLPPVKCSRFCADRVAPEFCSVYATAANCGIAGVFERDDDCRSPVCASVLPKNVCDECAEDADRPKAGKKPTAQRRGTAVLFGHVASKASKASPPARPRVRLHRLARAPAITHPRQGPRAKCPRPFQPGRV